MKIEIDELSPDRLNISVSGIVVGTVEEAHKFIQFVMTAWGNKRIDLEECERIFK